MSKFLKAKIITVLAILAGAFFISGHAFSIAKAATPTTFEMLGMSIRYSDAAGDDGIRFGVKLDVATYNALIADDNARAGILITPADQISGESLSLWTATASNARYGILYNGSENINNWTIKGNFAEGIVYIHGFPAASYNRPITVVAYIDWNNDGNPATVNHSDTVKISMSDVALSIITDYNGSNVNGTTAEQAEKLDDYLLDYDVEFLDENGQEIGVQAVKFGEEFTFPEDPDAYESRPFLGWQKRVGGTSEPEWAESLVDVGSENLTVKKNLQYKAYFAEKVQYTTTLYNKENIYGGDPSVTYKDGYYYYCSEDSQGRLWVLKSQSVEELLEDGVAGAWGQKTATCVYTPKSGDALGADVWAPELTYINGKWYIYVCGVPYGQRHGQNGYEEQMYVLECESQDPTGSYKTPVNVTPNSFNNKYAIDGHAFEYNGQLYYVFSGNNGSVTKPQLYMCTMNSPTSVNNDAVMINKDANTSKLKEGPCTVVDGNDLYLIYSCGTWNGGDYNNDNDYHLEYYKLTGSNPLNSSHWTAKGTCLQHGNGVYTVGHNHIFRNADGNLWTSYHGVVGTADAGTDAYLAKRRVFVQPISVENGALDFGGVQTTVEITEKAGLIYNNFEKTEYLVDGYGSGRLWKNYGNSFSVSTTITRTTTTGNSNQDKFCAGITLYERHGDGNISKLLIGVEKEGNIFFCNYYSRDALYYKYVDYIWSDRDVVNLTITYTAGGSASNSTIKIDISNNRDSKSNSRTYTLAEINALISDNVQNSDPLNKAFDLHFTGDFEIGLGGNRNQCTFTGVTFYCINDVGVAWNNEWGNTWNPYDNFYCINDIGVAWNNEWGNTWNPYDNLYSGWFRC